MFSFQHSTFKKSFDELENLEGYNTNKKEVKKYNLAGEIERKFV